MRLTYKAQNQHGKETGTVWYTSTAGNSIFPKSDKEEQALKKLAAYEDAEEQGRLVILPCKIGDMVYYFDPYDRIVSGKITMIQQKADKTWKFRVTTAFSHDVTIDAIGKTVFLTREEAEAALKGEK